jgi:hypothetical protein
MMRDAAMNALMMAPQALEAVEFPTGELKIEANAPRANGF